MSRLKTYNDGYLSVYESVKAESDFGAVVSAKTIDDMSLIVKLAYSERTKRASDFEFAEGFGKELSLKVCTQIPGSIEIKTNHIVVIEDKMYSVIDIDYDRANWELYIYLEEVGEVA